MILKRIKKVVGAIIYNNALEKKVREEKKNVANTDNESFLTS